MNRSDAAKLPASDASLPAQIDARCDAFEDAWQQGKNPRLEEYLRECPEVVRDRAFRELLEVELAYRRRAGEEPAAADYTARFPQFSTAIDVMFARTIAYSDAVAETHVKSESDPVTQVPESTSAAADAASPAASGMRFRIIRSFARGGLGEVLVAEDLELHRDVALKQIQLDFADDQECRTRFVLEAEITGRLEHPGVVPVYGLGKYADGRPFYAMRFIRGDSLKEAIEQFHAARKQNRLPGEPSLQLQKLLGRFIDVCDAIEYAHSRGIVHRDLKPANIMLGKYGETLVVDWGLAKVVGQPEPPTPSLTPVRPAALEGSAPTQLGRVVGTPQYMSPEQAGGRTDLVGPLSDVYGLGATLYCILTGRPPFSDGNVALDDILLLVERGVVAGPKQLNPAVPKPLDAICRKAMAHKPANRYASARALADDIEHWLADEPITALADTLPQRAARWVRRHRTWAYAVAATLLIVAVVSIVAAALVNNQRRIAAALAEANGQLAVKEQAARASAEASFRDARDAVDEFFTRVSDDTLLNQPGLQGLRKDLLEKTLAYYNRFVAERGSDPAVQEELAATLFKAGRIIDEVQSPDQAIPYFTRAQSIQDELLRGSPRDLKRLQALGDTDNALGRARQRSHQFAAALAAYQKAEDLRQQLVDLAPRDREYQRAAASVVMNIGVVEKDDGHFDAAERELEHAQQMRRRQLADGGDSPRLQRDLAMGSYNQGVLELARRRPATAANYFAEATERFDQLVRRDPRDLNLQFQLATCYRQSADLQSVEGPQDDSVRLYGLAQARFARLVDLNPDVSEYQSALAGVDMNLARRQQPAAAMESFGKSRAILGELAEKYPQNPQFRRDLAVALRSLAKLQLADGQRDAARKNLRDSIDYLTVLVERFPGNKDFAEQLAESRLAWDAAFEHPTPSKST